MNSYEIEPYIGVGPLHFSMRRADIHAILGAPALSRKSRFSDEHIDHWHNNGLQLSFSAVDESLLEISLYPGLPCVALSGIKLFEEAGESVYRRLCSLDNTAMEAFGVTVFFHYGIAAAGFLSGDNDQKSITAFSRGRWDRNDPNLKPIRLSIQ